MARRARSPQFETPTSRLKLKPRKVPYGYVGLAPGIRLGYRRNVGAGTWTVKVAIRGPAWTAKIGTADDLEKADGVHTLDFWQACDKARKVARGSDADAGRPLTVAEAVDAYEKDLRARNGSIANAGRIRKHLSPTLASKPVGMLTAGDLSRWRDGLLEHGMKRQTCLRLCRATKAALNLSARRDHRITNRHVWRDALSGLTETYQTRSASALTDEQVHNLIAAAYVTGFGFGLLTEVLAITGTRFSQAAKLRICDLQADRAVLLMPTSRKGRGRKAAHRPTPITIELAAKLKVAAANRAADAPLLTRDDGGPWRTNDHWRLFEKTAARAGLKVTAYSLRHSSIIRSLLAGTPARLVASVHDTSLSELERSYSPFISDHGDQLVRRGLLTPQPPPPDAKVVPLAGRK